MDRVRHVRHGKNPSKYVVRLAQNVVLQPSGISGSLVKTYILPGETMTVSMGKSVSGNTKVKFFPASRYGVEVPSFISDLNKNKGLWRCVKSQLALLCAL